MSVGAPLDLSAPPPIPQAARDRVAARLANGRLHRYREGGGPPGAVAELEAAFAELIGTRYAVATNSCGSALYLALLGAGVQPGEPVLMSGFTLAPVVGSVANAGALPVAVEITPDLVLDLDDLAAKAAATGARYLLVSHMRGHVCDLDRVADICDSLGLALIEDCAHSLGATWAGRPTGAFGLAAAFSFQSWKHINAGEGGILTTSDDDLAARAILHSGSYMLYSQNGTCPPDAVMERWRDRCANFSLRLSEIAAELALPQIDELPVRAADWNASHDRIAAGLASIDGVALAHRPEAEGYVQSSLQFRLPDLAPPQMASFVAGCRDSGLFVKWFGTAAAEGYTSGPRHWSGLPGTPTAPRTQAILDTLCDFRLPLGLAPAACDSIVDIVAAALGAATATRPA
jgi:dTDP-4-amino-4,6-dideoxygalactose transaminase